MGGISVQNLRKAKLPPNLNTIELSMLKKHSDKYIVVIFEAESSEDADSFASFLRGLSSRSTGGYLQQVLQSRYTNVFCSSFVNIYSIISLLMLFL